MHLTCPSCQHVLEYSQDRPAFCSQCGRRLSSPDLQGPTEINREAATVSPAPPRPSADPAPETVGGYRLLRKLGEGGMGTVYEAEGPGGGRVALKLIGPEFADSPEAVERFRREGQLASSIAHPRCVFVLAADEEAGRPYLVMERMPGPTLQDLVKERGPLPPGEAVAKILDVIDGVQAAHDLGVIHRDLKPNNCFLEAEGRVKVGDFGLAKSLIAKDHLTRTGTFLGTLLYSSPEQIRRDPNQPVDAQSDLYAVAATLYFLLTGRAPFQSEDAVAAMARIVTDPAPSMRSLRPEILAGLDRAVLRGLERDRGRRWQNLDEFRTALVPFLPGAPSRASLGSRFAAFVVDQVLIWLPLSILLSAELLDAVLWGTSPSLTFRVLCEAVLSLAWFAYFTVGEATLGRTVGKWLFNLRVVQSPGLDPPGWAGALVRSLVFFGPSLVGDILSWIFHDDDNWSGLAWLGATVAGMVATFCTMRRSNGFRGLHELLSGTQVVQSPPRPGRFPSTGQGLSPDLPRPDDLPDRVGPYVIQGVFRATITERVLLGEEKALGRKVVVWLHALGESTPSSQPEIIRSTRWRRLACGHYQGQYWEAFPAPRGASLVDLANAGKRFSWPETSLILDQLAGELAAACSEGSLPDSLELDQVWLQPHGLQLLDVSLNPTGRTSDSPSVAPPQRALHFLGQVARLALEGPSGKNPESATFRVPLPGRARRLLDRLVELGPPFSGPDEFREGLAETRKHPQEVGRPQRASHLLTLGLFLLPGWLWTLMGSMFLLYTPLFDLHNQITDGKRLGSELDEWSTRALALSSLDPQLAKRLNGFAQWQVDRDVLARQREKLRHWGVERRARLRACSWLIRGSIESNMESNYTEHLNAYRPLEQKGFLREGIDYYRVLVKRDAEVERYFELPTSQEEALFLGLFVLLWPVVWASGALLFRGGPSFWFHGLALVRGDGRKAGRLRCAWRAFLVWTPPATFLALSLGLHSWYWRYWEWSKYLGTWDETTPYPLVPWLSSLSWWLGVGLLPLWVILALRSPARGLHDRLAGTVLVPK